MKDFILEFLSKRPETIGAFGYGSGVFKQLGYENNDKPQIDLILIVNDIKDWHEKNSKENPKDYSFISKRFLTGSSKDKIKGLTGITYQSNILYNGHLFKYGVIEYSDFLVHMETWDSFYVPGRFQKPILIIKSNPVIDETIFKNRYNACKIGLLCMEGNTILDLYMSICSLSYTGDARMGIAENPNKVKNIVGASRERFDAMYSFGDLYNRKDEEITYDINLNDLPSALQNYIGKSADLKTIREKVLQYLYIVNEKESKQQTFKGIKTNGVFRSVKYGFAKVLKKFR